MGLAILRRARQNRSALRASVASPAARRCLVAVATWRTVDTATLVAVSAHLFSQEGTGAVAWFGAVRTLGPAVGVPLLLARAARWPPGRVLAGCALLAAGGSAGTAAAIATTAPPAALLLAAASTGVGLYCFRPLLGSLFPTLVRSPEQLVAINASAGVVDGASTLVGPVLGGIALATTGAAGVGVAGAVALVVVAAAMVEVRGAADVVARTDHGGRRRSIGDGFRAMAANRTVTGIVATGFAQTFVRGSLNVLVVVLAVDALDMGDAGVGVLLAAIGLGSLVGWPVAARVARPGRLARALGVGLVLWGAPIALAALVPAPVPAACLFAVIGIGNSMVNISTNSMLQRLVPTGHLGATLGGFETVLYVGMAAGSVVAGRLLTTTGIAAALVVTGLVLPVLTVVAWRWLERVDAALAERDTDVALLQLQAVFTPLVIATVDHLARVMGHVTYAGGEVIVAKGDRGDRYLLVEDGVVEIVDGDIVVDVLGPGAGFGEMSLLRDIPRTATARARTAVRARWLSREDFALGVASEPRAQERAEQLVVARLQENRARAGVDAGADDPARPAG